jgi:hypothetical protein
MMPGHEKDHECGEGHDGQGTVIPAKEAPGGPCVAPVDKFEEAVDHDIFLGVTQQAEDQELGDLVEKDHD